MFGKMTVSKLLETCQGEGLDSSAAKLLEITDGAEVARWLQFPASLMLFVVVPGDPESGAVYLLDRKSGAWYWVDFEDEKYGGYSEADFDCLMKSCRFARLVEQPRLLETAVWCVTAGVGPELLGVVPRPARRRHQSNLTNSGAHA